MVTLSRRQFLASAATLGAFSAAPTLLMPSRSALAAPATTIRIGTRAIEVNGRAAEVFGLTQPDGTHGLFTESGQRFRVRLENRIDEKTLVHWHGLTPPWQQDGVPSLSQPALQPGGTYDYDFLLERPGTNWMHSHLGLQEQRLMAAPLIVRNPAERTADVQEVVVMLHDFTFRDPDEILAGLRREGHGPGHGSGSPGHGDGSAGHQPDAGHGDHGANPHHGAASDPHAGHGQPHHSTPPEAAPAHPGHGAPDAGDAHLHDVDYDAFLANDRMLDDPEVFRVESGGRVRLRLINAATATNFWIDLDRLQGRLIAVDGIPVEPVEGRRFEFAIAQRLDILLDLPHGEGAWPVFAQREGDTKRTGFVLATRCGAVSRLAPDAHHPADPVGLALERRLKAAEPLPTRSADRSHTVAITEAPGYVWMLNGKVHGEHEPLVVREGERVEVTFVDETTMAHPMHLHGHHFQVVAINGDRISGAVRDTVLVPASGRVTIAFEASNPGKWALHCHHLYHMAGGMMTTVEYAA